MQTQAQPDAAPFIAEITRGLIGCLGEAPGEADPRQDSYTRTLAFCIKAYQPRDILELTAAQHCLTFHYALDDAAYDMLREPDTITRDKSRRQVNAFGRTYLSHERVFQRLRRRGPHELVIPLVDVPAAAASEAAGETARGATAEASGPPVPGQDRTTRSAAVGPPVDAGREFSASHAGIMAAARVFAEQFAPAAPAIKPISQPPSPPPPMNRQQRRLAEKLARKQARRAASLGPRAPRGGGAG